MPPVAVRFRVARPENVPRVVEMMAQATRWLQARGEPAAWPIPFPSERLLASVNAGELFLVELAGAGVVGTVTLQWADPLFWGARPPDAGYVHRLVVRRQFAGRGIGDAMLVWAEERVRARGRSFVRLDCLASSAPLHRYYSSRGFRRVGEVSVRGLRAALFEKRVVGSRGPSRPRAPAASAAHSNRFGQEGL
jgi:ribosomal protein S18 acetylase RimI-like enzyme